MEDGVYGQMELAASHVDQEPLQELDHALPLQRQVLELIAQDYPQKQLHAQDQ